MSKFFNDSPIENTDDDQYGVSSFAKAISKSIQEISSPVGTTIAINGPWGAGKSSAVNLIRNELQAAKNSNLTMLDFKCWWYRGEEALTLAFFQELNSVLKQKLGDQVKNLVPALGKHILQAGPVLGAAVSFLPAGSLLSPLVSGGADFAKRFFPEGETLEKTFEKLSKVLQNQPQRFLVIIDDIDRLSADEALAIFRLVKSAGRLPNVMYLLVFDRELADAAVQQRYPSEGPHFLEKIIQASFELPAPIQTDLNNAFLVSFERMCGDVDDADAVRFMNIFYDAVVPYLVTPRHVTRLINAVSVTWPAVANEVDKADFMALEAIRLYEPKLYNAIRTNRDVVIGAGALEHRRNQDRFTPFTAQIDDERHSTVRVILQRLFPALEEIHYDSGFTRQWDAARRVCIGKHFDTYFRLSLSDEAISSAELQTFFANVRDKTFVSDTFLQMAKRSRKNGRTMVPVLLDELTAHAQRVEKDGVLPLLSALFSIVDEISFDVDSERGFSIGNTPLRVHWLIRRLTENRFDIEERTALYLDVTKGASFDWLIDFTSSAVSDYVEKDGSTTPSERCLVSSDGALTLKAQALTRLKAAAADGSLAKTHNLMSNLYRWRDFSDDDGAEMRAWVAESMKRDEVLITFAKKLTSESWSQGMGYFDGLGDRVAKRSIRAGISADFDLFDTANFKAELERIVRDEAAAAEDIEAVQTFLTAFEKRNREGRD